MKPAIQLPRLYPIVDAAQFRDATDPVTAISAFAAALMEGGASLIQYRNKLDSPRQMLGQARELRRRVGDRARLIMNDRVDLCLAAGFDGVHLGQDDLQPESARRILETALPGGGFWVGYSTHNPEQVQLADQMPVDYIAVGPVFATGSKANPDPVIGLEGVRQARKATQKPLVAIGGITRANCLRVVEAGADSVAVISDLVQSPRQTTEEFLRILE